VPDLEVGKNDNQSRCVWRKFRPTNKNALESIQISKLL